MEKTLVFTHRLDLAMRLVDTTSGRNISGRNVSVFIDGEQVRFSEKGDMVLIFQHLDKRNFKMKITSPIFEECQADIDLDKLDKKQPLIEIHLVPGKSYPGSDSMLTVTGTLFGIKSLSAVRLGDNVCLMREVDERKRLAKVFNPHHLSLDRVYYALVDPERAVFEPMKVIKKVDENTLKLEKNLEMPFKNYFPVTPEVFGKASTDGSYCLRLRDDAADARWLIRWETDEGPKFKTVDFRKEQNPLLEEGGG